MKTEFCKYIRMNFGGLIACLFMISPLCGCEKLIEVPGPVTSTNSDNVYASDATAAAVLTGIYTTISKASFPDGGLTSVSLFSGLSTDELILFSNVTREAYIGYYTNSLTDLNTTNGATDFWTTIYPVIYISNAAIEGLTGSTSLKPDVKQRLLGEAKFIRAFCYFYLVNLYGDVPLTLSSDFQVNSLLGRTVKSEVWQQIITDLKDAQELLSDNYLGADMQSPTTERVRPNKWAATALLARAYLYADDWANAESQATALIDNTNLYNLTSDLNDVFLSNSTEAIWQLQPVLVQYNTQDARLFVLPDTGPNNTQNFVYLNDRLLNSFEAGDLRKSDWIGNVSVDGSSFYYPHKYKVANPGSPVTEYSMVLRLAEQYLIRAEARAQLGDIAGAAADLNAIRNRAGLPNTTASTKEELLTMIEHERQVELFTEWGHRWLDLKRTNRIDAVMPEITMQKGGTWETTDQLYPIPFAELQINPKLVQNPGY